MYRSIVIGVIDAAVQGGVTKYREAFFTGKYAAAHPEHGMLRFRHGTDVLASC